MDLSQGLQAYYEFSEASGTRYDSHGVNHLDVITGTPTQDNGLPVGGKAVGTSLGNFLQTASGFSPLDPPEAFGYTFIAWHNQSSLGTTSAFANKVDYTIGVKEGWRTYYLNTGQVVGVHMEGPLPAPANPNVILAPSTPIGTGEWHHFVFRHQHFGKTKIWHDYSDTKQSPNNAGFANPPSSMPFSVGIINNLGALVFTGSLAQMAFYHRETADSEVYWLYNNGNGRRYGSLRGNRGRERNPRSRKAA